MNTKADKGAKSLSFLFDNNFEQCLERVLLFSGQ